MNFAAQFFERGAIRVPERAGNECYRNAGIDGLQTPNAASTCAYTTTPEAWPK